MTTTLPAPPTTTAPRPRRGPVRRALGAWPRWTPYAAALWSLAYCALATTWALGTQAGPRYPFDRAGDPDNDGGILWYADREVTAAVVAVLCLAGVAVAGLVARRAAGPLTRPLTRPLVAFAALAAVTLTVVVPDQRILTAIGYLPIVVVGAPWDFPPVSYADAWPWPVQNQVILMLGGVLWAATAVVAARRGGGEGAAGRWTTPESARRWGRWATGVAVAVPLLYALDRLAWLAGVNLGVSDELVSNVRDTDLRYAALGLALGAIGGAVLTLGLAQRWGEVFPRWIPFLRGRRVPPALAVVPASFVAIAVTSAGLTVVRMLITQRDSLPAEDLGAVVPMVLWPFWGVALGAATLAYHLRRRG
jgi:hypothetical protein